MPDSCLVTWIMDLMWFRLPSHCFLLFFLHYTFAVYLIIHLKIFLIMAQGYILVLRPSEPGNKDSEKKYYAMSKSTGVSDMKRLCKLISARSTVSSADVKAVLDNLNYVLDLELQDGRIVQMGEFGNFRFTVGSEGVDDPKKFSASMIRAPRIVFTPGSELRDTKKTLEFRSANEKGSTASGNDRPDEV